MLETELYFDGKIRSLNYRQLLNKVWLNIFVNTFNDVVAKIVKDLVREYNKIYLSCYQKFHLIKTQISEMNWLLP